MLFRSVQLNGRIRAKLMLAAGAGKDEAIAAAKEDAKVKEAIEGKTIVKEIYVPGKIVNIVVK